MFMKMPRRIIYYVVFLTLVWGVFADNEENIRNLFQNNVTRADFGNLLQSLIKLNEQRVNVLQKLYRLEDYGVISEVLRSGDQKATNGNKNLLLVVLSKNQSSATRRDMDGLVVDSIPLLDIKPDTISQNPIINPYHHYKHNNPINTITEKYQIILNTEPTPIRDNDSQLNFELNLGGGTAQEIKLRKRFTQAFPAHNRVKYARTTKSLTEGSAEDNIDNNYPKSDQDEDKNIMKYPITAVDTVKVAGKGKKRNKNLKARFKIDSGRNKGTHAGIQRMKGTYPSTNYPETVPFMNVGDVNNNHYVVTPLDVPDVIDSNNVNSKKVDLDEQNKIIAELVKKNIREHINKTPKAPKIMVDANHNKNKEFKPKNDTQDGLNSETSKPNNPITNQANGKHDKVFKILKDMYDTGDYPHLSMATDSESESEAKHHLRKKKSRHHALRDVEVKIIARKNLQKCIGKKALKLCTKSCNTAYKNVCTRLKCTSKSKKSLKKECKKSCTKTFSSSKYSSEDYDD